MIGSRSIIIVFAAKIMRRAASGLPADAVTR